MPDEVIITVKVKREISDEVSANISEYLEDFYGPGSQNPQDFTVTIEEIKDDEDTLESEN